MDVLQHADIRPHALGEEPPLPGASLHGQREGRQLPGAFVDLDAVEVIREDLPRDLGRLVAFLLINGIEQVEGIGQHVAGTAGRIADPDLFRRADTQEVRLGLFGPDVIVHLLNQLRAGTVEQPQAAEGVLDQIADDPVRGEELGGGGDVLGVIFLFCFRPSNTSSFFSEM